MRAIFSRQQRLTNWPASPAQQCWQVSCRGVVKPAANFCEQGQALVEFALVLMFIILPFTFVLVDGAMLLFTLANVSNAAREGARGGSIYQTASAATVATIDTARLTYMQQSAQQMLGSWVNFDQCAKQATYSPTTPDMGNPYRELDTLTFRIDCPRRMFFGLVGTSVITLSAEATMRIEPGGVAPLP